MQEATGRCTFGSQKSATLKTMMLYKYLSGVNGQNGLDKENTDIKVYTMGWISLPDFMLRYTGLK